MERIFVQCKVCNSVAEIMREGEKPIQCCGKTMGRIVANSTDASIEKHVPSVEINGEEVTVFIGEAEHPSTQEHHIQWIMFSQGKKSQQVAVSPGEKPRAKFLLDKDGSSAFSVHAICNLHGLWKKNVSHR